jgi:cation:H+ antiporter
MELAINIALIVGGIFFVLQGAEKMTDGAIALAQRMKVPQIVIGLTIVACGTSMPEFFVSLTSSLQGSADMAIGNVVGSNIFNTLLIVGVSAMVAPMVIARSTVRKDIPMAFVSSIMLGIMSLDGTISRLDAAILFIGFLLFMVYTIQAARKGEVEVSEEEQKGYGVWRSIFYIALGLAMLIVGSNIFVDSASEVARTFGISDAVIGLTIVACGTSMPELATSVVAAKKGQSALAIGNVIGSNVFNILMVLGLTGIINPLRMKGITNIDLILQFAAITLVWLFSYTRFKVERWEGTLLSLVFLTYLTWLVVNAL